MIAKGHHSIAALRTNSRRDPGPVSQGGPFADRAKGERSIVLQDPEIPRYLPFLRSLRARRNASSRDCW